MNYSSYYPKVIHCLDVTIHNVTSIMLNMCFIMLFFRCVMLLMLWVLDYAVSVGVETLACPFHSSQHLGIHGHIPNHIHPHPHPHPYPSSAIPFQHHSSIVVRCLLINHWPTDSSTLRPQRLLNWLKIGG